MKLFILILFVISSTGFACSNHPGTTHEHWTSAIKDERNKDGSTKVMSDNFFSSKENQGNRNSNSYSKGGRPVAPEGSR